MSLFSLRFDGAGLINTESFRTYLRRHLHDCYFRDLRIPFFVICTDLETGREVIIHKGSVVDALLASSAIPGVFAPVEIDGRLLVDGGLSNNVPVSVLVNQQARYTVAVRLHREVTALDAPPIRRSRSSEAEKEGGTVVWSERLRQTIRFQKSTAPSGLDVVARGMEIAVARLESIRLQAYPPDILIAPEVIQYSTLSLTEEKENIFNCGVRAAEAQRENLTVLSERLSKGLTVGRKTPLCNSGTQVAR